MELVVKTRDGTPVTHDVTNNTVRIVGVDGEAKGFVFADDVPEAVEKTVNVDWSEGDMVVTPEAGQVFSSILIPKPETAIPENILKDVNLGGVIGAAVAGSGNSVKFAAGRIAGTGGVLRISHGLGVVPDFCLVFLSSSLVNIANGYFLAGYYAAAGVITTAATGALLRTSISCVTGVSSLDVTDTTISAGSSSYKTIANYNYYNWIAISGLT